MSRTLHVLVVVALFAACDRPGDPAKARAFAARALRGALAYPNSRLVTVSAGDEAAELVLASPDSAGAIAAWYRQVLPLNGWEIRRDVRGRDGSITIYAEQGERPFWLTVRPSTGAAGATYTMVGAVVDTTATKN